MILEHLQIEFLCSVILRVILFEIVHSSKNNNKIIGREVQIGGDSWLCNEKITL